MNRGQVMTIVTHTHEQQLQLVPLLQKSKRIANVHIDIVQLGEFMIPCGLGKAIEEEL